MKTLDEAIAELEDEGVFPDALHYLKAYREDKDELDRTRLAYLDVLTDYVALKNYWAEQQANPPLTWDELRQMEGKPVWVEWTVRGEWCNKEWDLVHAMIDDRIWFVDGNGEITDVPEDLMGKTWQAYRKERQNVQS